MLDWMARQLDAPGTLAGLLQAVVLLCGVALPILFWRADRRRRGLDAIREADALSAIADHVCDLVVAVADALRDEVNANDFVDGFDQRRLIDAEMMLQAIPSHSLPSLRLLGPLFELRRVAERSVEVAAWLPQAMDDPEREGWRDTADEMHDLAEDAAIAAEAFRKFARDARHTR